MLTSFYRRHSAALLWLALLSFPFLYARAQAIRQNNNIETWLPRESPVRAAYEQFKKDFGVEEVILIGLDRRQVPEEVAEGLCGRIERLPGIRKCWSTSRLMTAMRDMGVSKDQSLSRLKGLAVSDDGSMTALIALLSDAGVADRKAAVRAIRGELDYCELSGSQSFLTGGPVIITELDRLGGQRAAAPLFSCSLLLCLGLLYYWTRNWKLALSVVGLTLWAIQCTVATFAALGGEMNFILGALPVMVMVFTLEASLHVLHYYFVSKSAPDPMAQALKLCWKPCLVSMATTTVGLFSVSVTDIVPVEQFGYAAALGAVVAMMTGLLFTPALVLVLLPKQVEESHHSGVSPMARAGRRMLNHSTKIVVAAVIVVALGSAGILHLRSKISALDFFPRDAQVLKDLRQIEDKLTNMDSVEAVVTFDNLDEPFVSRLQKVRELEQKIAKHPAVRHTMSAATFFPDPPPTSTFEIMSLLRKAQARRSESDLIADGERLWRISARISPRNGQTAAQVYRQLQQDLAGEPILFTGIAPLIEQAQHEIFQGFWSSFLWAVVVIGIVMTIALWSPSTALMAMIPNVAPLCVVFGVLGWLGIPVDIGMMMTGSIALGISVDGTFHFLVRYQEQIAAGRSRMHSVRVALLTTGGPIFESIAVSSAGMLALMLSNFAPTYRFGLLMAVLLMATLSGTLVLLPCLLAMGPTGIRRRVPKPHFEQIQSVRFVPIEHVA